MPWSPKSLREAIHRAMVELGNLRGQLPGAKVGQVLDTLDRIESIWEKQDTGQFPLNALINEISALRAELSETYADDLDQQVDRGSLVFDQITHLDHRLRIYSESIVYNPVFAGLEKRLERLEKVLPPRNYAVKQLLGDLRLTFDPRLTQRIESAFVRFEQEQYEETIGECGRAGEICFSMFRTCLEKIGICELPEHIGKALPTIRKKLEIGKDNDGLILARSGRLESLVVSMLETLHYLRNVAVHDRAEERSQERLPTWQIERRELFTQRPEYARLALVLTVQVALELQVLYEHIGISSYVSDETV